MKIIPRNAPPREGARPGPTLAALLPPVGRAAPELSAHELAERAGEAAMLSAELGVPDLTPEKAQDLVLVIDPKARPIADTLRFVLTQAPTIVARSGQRPEDLAERNAQIGAMMGIRRIGEGGERACQLIRGAKVRVEQELLERLLKEIRAELARLTPDREAYVKLAGDAGELMELLGRREARRKTQLGKGQKQTAEGEAKIKAQARETRALRTIVALQGGEAVDDADAEAALSYLEEVAAKDEGDGRRTPR